MKNNKYDEYFIRCSTELQTMEKYYSLCDQVKGSESEMNMLRDAYHRARDRMIDKISDNVLD